MKHAVEHIHFVEGPRAPTKKRAGREFATENLMGRGHAVGGNPAVPAPRNFGPFRVPEGSYFMMGDNRDESFYSRYWGTVERRRIVGRVGSVVVSLDPDHWRLPRWGRTFQTLD